VHGYNAQAATTARQIVIAAELINSSADFGHIAPAVDAARRELQAAGVTNAVGVVLADAVYWHQDQMQALAADGLQVLIPRMPSPAGAALYRQRHGMIESVFAHTKFNRKIDPF
jgi:hypothetical protein